MCADASASPRRSSAYADDADIILDLDPGSERLGFLLYGLEDPLGVRPRGYLGAAERCAIIEDGGDRIDPHDIRPAALECGHGHRRIVKSAPHGVAVETTAGTADVEEQAAQTVEDRLALVDLHCTHDMRASTHHDVGTRVDRLVEQRRQKIRYRCR